MTGQCESANVSQRPRCRLSDSQCERQRGSVRMYESVPNAFSESVRKRRRPPSPRKQADSQPKTRHERGRRTVGKPRQALAGNGCVPAGAPCRRKGRFFVASRGDVQGETNAKPRRQERRFQKSTNTRTRSRVLPVLGPGPVLLVMAPHDAQKNSGDQVGPLGV